jgi:hypothetical protein
VNIRVKTQSFVKGVMVPMPSNTKILPNFLLCYITSSTKRLDVCWHLLLANFLLGFSFGTDDEDITLLQNISERLPSYTAVHPTRQYSSYQKLRSHFMIRVDAQPSLNM